MEAAAAGISAWADSAFVKTVPGRSILAAVHLYGTEDAFYDQTWKPDDLEVAASGRPGSRACTGSAFTPPPAVPLPPDSPFTKRALSCRSNHLQSGPCSECGRSPMLVMTLRLMTTSGRSRRYGPRSEARGHRTLAKRSHRQSS